MKVMMMTYPMLMVMKMSLIWIWPGKCWTSQGLLLTNSLLIQWRKLIYSVPLLKFPWKEVFFFYFHLCIVLFSRFTFLSYCVIYYTEDIESSLSDYKKALSILERLVEPDSRHIAELYPLISYRLCSFSTLCLLDYINLT